jgi:hypothetical protein
MAAPKIPAPTREEQLANTLKWIRMITGMHYFGGAFEPEHMRELANMAADALAGRLKYIDYDEAMERAQERAREMAESFAKMLAPDEPGDEPDAR